jgi:UrcA family protein
MFSILLLGFAAAVGAESNTVSDNRPTIGIDVGGYNLRDEHELLRVQGTIHRAAIDVCMRGYGVALYEERVACVKSAIADGNAQLQRILAKRDSSLAAAAAISKAIGQEH